MNPFDKTRYAFYFCWRISNTLLHSFNEVWFFVHAYMANISFFGLIFPLISRKCYLFSLMCYSNPQSSRFNLAANREAKRLLKNGCEVDDEDAAISNSSTRRQSALKPSSSSLSYAGKSERIQLTIDELLPRELGATSKTTTGEKKSSREPPRSSLEQRFANSSIINIEETSSHTLPLLDLPISITMNFFIEKDKGKPINFFIKMNISIYNNWLIFPDHYYIRIQ